MKNKTIIQIVVVLLVLFSLQIFVQLKFLRKSAVDRMMDFKAKVNLAVNNAMVGLDKLGISEYYEKEGNQKLIDELRKMNCLMENIIGDKDTASPEYQECFEKIVTEISSDNYDFAVYDSVISKSLKSYGIEFKYVMAFYDEASRNFIFKSDDSVEDSAILGEGVANSYLVVNSSGTVGMLRLVLYFPGLKNHFYSITLSAWINLLIMILIMYIVVFILMREKETNDIKTAFMNNMTHELKTPISTIKLVCEAMQDDSFDLDKDSARGMVKMIEDENNRMYSLVDHMLKAVKVSRGYDVSQMENVDVHNCINSALDSLSVLVNSQNAVVVKNFNATDAIIKSQTNNLIGSFSNIIDNALKYSNGAPVINISTHNVGKKIVIKISDKGIGISKDEQKKIFDEFFRADTGNRHDIKGYGIGLSYVKSVVTHSKGVIGVESVPGKGTTFTITFPVQKA